MKNKNNLQINLVPVLLLAVAVFAAVYFTIYNYPKYVSLQSDISKKELMIGEMQKINDEQKRTDSAELAKLFKKAKAALPNQKNTSGIISGLSKVASDSAIVVKRVETFPGLVSTVSGIKKESTDPTSVPTSISVSASIDQMLSFLKNLESSSQIILIKSLGYSSKIRYDPRFEISALMLYQTSDQDWTVDMGLPPITDEERQIISPLPDEDVFLTP